jgi:hypothetical protein
MIDGLTNDNRLTLGELETFPGFLLAVLLPFDHTRVTSQQTGIPKRLPGIFVNSDQGARDSEFDCARLTGRTASLNADSSIIATLSGSYREWLEDLFPQDSDRKVLFQFRIVDGHFAGPLRELHTGNGGFPATNSNE